MQNLISNAIKYDGESRWARISAQMWARKQANEVRITVEDRGLGISSADIVHIFEPFYRGHEAVAAQIKGSGVGLSLVKQIVEAHKVFANSSRHVDSAQNVVQIIANLPGCVGVNTFDTSLVPQ